MTFLRQPAPNAIMAGTPMSIQIAPRMVGNGRVHSGRFAAPSRIEQSSDHNLGWIGYPWSIYGNSSTGLHVREEMELAVQFP